EPALQLCRRTNNLLYLVQVIGTLGHARALDGAPGEGLALLETAVAQAHARRPAVLVPTLTWQAEALFLAGRPGEARPAGERALAQARERGERRHDARALHALGRFALEGAPTELDVAARHLGQALARAEALGMRPLLAHVHLALGRLGRRRGAGAEAATHLTAAVSLYREMDMRLWLSEAEASLRS